MMRQFALFIALCAPILLNAQTSPVVTVPASGVASTVIPISSSYQSGNVVRITNGSTSTDCTTGGGSNVVLCYWTGSAWASASGTRTTNPGGANTDIQFNNAGAFGGVPNWTWDGTNIVLNGSGALTLAGLANPAAPTLTVNGTAGTTTISYEVVAVEGASTTAASAAATTTTANATLSGSNTVTVTTAAVTNSTACKVYRTATNGTSPATHGLIGSVTCGTALTDTGLAGDGTTPSAVNNTGTVTARNFVASGPGASYTQWTTGALSVGASGTVLCGANAGNVLACSDNGGALANVAFAGNDLGVSSGNLMNVIGLHLTAPGNLGSQPLTQQFNNDTTTGTVQNLLAKQGGNATEPSAIKIATTDTNVAVYPVVSATGTSGAAILAVSGDATCTFDNATVYADYVVASTTTAGDCHDDGATIPAGPIYVAGTVAQAGGAAGNYSVKGPGWFMSAGATFQVNSTATSAQSPINFQSGSGIAVSNLSAGNVSVALAAQTVFFSGQHNGGNQAASLNAVHLSGFYLPYPVTFSHIEFVINTADTTGGDLYDIGIYTHAGVLEADIGATAFSTAAAEDIATKQGAVTIQPGQYYFGYTGNAVTAVLDTYTCGSFYSASAAAVGSSSGGALPLSITAPTDAFTTWDACFDFVLH